MQIKPFTMSILVGSAACDARCPFCVSKMTPPNGVTLKHDAIDYRNFHQACTLAKQSGVTTILLTGKGEPTLFPAQITEVLKQLQKYDFPIIELQTNGIPLAEEKLDDLNFLHEWFELGLRMIAVSNVGIDPELNRSIYTPHKATGYPILAKTIDKIHSHGYSVRLATVMIRGGVDSWVRVDELIQFSKQHKVEQIKLCPVTMPHSTTEAGLNAVSWIESNHITDSQIRDIHDWLKLHGHLLLTLPHDAEVYDVEGQNICLSNCLTHSSDPDSIRQLIYWTDGSLRYSWEYPGARIL